MTRKEEILGYCGESNYKPFSVEACTAIKAIEWADQHPRKGLWDAEKVIYWLRANFEQYAYNYGIDEVIGGLRKAMEN